MAKQLAGPNFSMVKSNVEILSTLDLLDDKAGVVYSNDFASQQYALPIYYNPYVGAQSYATSTGITVPSPFSSLNDSAYAAAATSQQGVDLGIDYSDYSNFIHFGSAKERLEHFRDKVQTLHFHRDQANTIQTQYTATPTYQSESINYHINEASQLLREFDGYDIYLYFETGSTTWPKDSDGNLYTVDSTPATNWYTAQLEVAEEFDLQNQNRLLNTLPDYIKEDSVNNPALIFCDMLGHHYDEVLTYAQGISQKHNTDNRLSIGASRDMLRDILKSFGIKLYKSQFRDTDLAKLYVGSFYPTGSEQIETMISASDSIPSMRDFLDSTNKRLYHNIAHLLQVKGTKRGLRALINTFGVPSDILPIFEFGGVDTSGQNFGPENATSSSLDKIRLDNTGSLLSGSTLSYFTGTTEFDSNYSKDTHVVEIGWSPSTIKNEYIKGEVAADYNIDDYIGDPRQQFTKNYTDLEALSKSILDTSEERTIYDFLRLLKYYDNRLFAMLEDFAPARTSIRKGAIIKPHLLERSKAGVGSMEVTEEQYTGSINMYTVTGSEGDVINQDTTNTYTVNTVAGPVTETVTDQRERFNGELGGSTITVSNGELNEDNPLKRPTSIALNYDVTVRTNLETFNSSTISLGEMEMYYFNPRTLIESEIPEDPPGTLPVGVTQEDITLEIIKDNSDIEGLGVSLTRVESDVYSDDDVLIFSTTQAGSYTISDIGYTGDDIVVQAYAYDTGNPPASITIEIKNGATVVESGTGSGSVTITNQPGELVVGSSTLVIQVRIS